MKRVTSQYTLLGLLLLNMVSAILLPTSIYLFVFWVIMILIIFLAISSIRAALFLSSLFDFITTNTQYIEECKPKKIDEYMTYYLTFRDPIKIFSREFENDYLKYYRENK